MAFKIQTTPKFEKNFLKILSKSLQKRVGQEIRTLTNDPFGVTRMADIKKLRGQNQYRLRVGDYRIFYEIDKANKEVVLLTVAHRKDCY